MSDSPVQDVGATLGSLPTTSAVPSVMQPPSPMPARAKESGAGVVVETANATVTSEATVAGEGAAVAEDFAPVEAVSQAIEVEKRPEVPPEVEAWVEEVGHHADQFPQEVKFVPQDLPMSDPTAVPQYVPVLPVSQQTMVAGLKAKVTSSVRWLSTWCLRLVKKFHGAVAYTEPAPSSTTSAAPHSTPSSTSSSPVGQS